MIKNVLTSKEVANVLDVSSSTACKYIKRMNKEMEKQGYFTISGRVPVKMFQEKFPYHEIPEEILKGKERLHENTINISINAILNNSNRRSNKRFLYRYAVISNGRFRTVLVLG